MVSVLDVFVLSVALAMDCFTVSIMSGVVLRRGVTAKVWRMAVLFGVFQALMPLLGWLATARLGHYVASVDHWVAFALLSFVGGKMVWESLRGDGNHPTFDPLRLRTQLLLAVATSIDALAVGVSLVCLGYDHAWQLSLPLTMIGVMSTVLSLAGYFLGVRFGRVVSKRLKPELVGGLLLLIIGVKVLLSHL